MTNEQITEYLLKNEALRYEKAKELQRTIRHVIVALIASLTILAGLYIYFVVPVESEELVIDGNSKVVMENNLSNGSHIWQLEEKE